MKLTEKYCLCDMCSKPVELSEVNGMTKFLYFTSKKILVEYERFELNILYCEKSKVSHLFDILKRTKEKYLCKECIKNLYKNCFPIQFPIQFPHYPNAMTGPIQYDKIAISGFETNGRIEFAESKNKKLAQVYFAPINVQIANSEKED